MTSTQARRSRVPSARPAPRLAAALLVVLVLVALSPARASGTSTAAAAAATVAPAGPQRLSDVTPDVGSGVVFHGRLYFPGTTAATGRELWVTDGTAAGTHEVVDLIPGVDSSSPYGLTVFDDRLYFTAATPSTGYELFSTDGTADGTRLLRDIYPGADSSVPGSLVVAAGALWFAAFSPTDGRELWITDGTLAHTHQVVDLVAGVQSSSPSQLTSLGDRVVFTASSSSSASKPWVAQPGQPVRRLDALDPSVNIHPHQLRVLGSHVVFAAGQDDVHGEELWVTDGQPGDAHELKDINPGPATGAPYPLTVGADRIWFSAIAPGVGSELWRSDGTPGGTVLAKDVRPGVASSTVSTLVGNADRLFFNANDGTHGVELWTASGADVHLVLDAVPGPGSGASNGFDALASAVGRLVVYAGTDAAGTEPWVSDGTAAGTHRIADLAAGPGDSAPYRVGVLGETLIFAASTNDGFGVYAWTAPGPVAPRASSRAVAHARRHYPARQARHRRIRVPVTVTTTGGAPLTGGTVTLVRRGRIVGSAALVGGIARVRVTARLRPHHRYVLRARWSGTATATPSVSASFRVRVVGG
jgi:ELWxxDGT repeat protein